VEPSSGKRTFNKIFGLGLGRTGTTSLVKALNILGIKTMHWPVDRQIEECLIKRPETVKLHLLEEYDAITNEPMCSIYPILDRSYPNSKFILTVREKTSWLKSSKWWHEEAVPFRESLSPGAEWVRYGKVIHRYVYGIDGWDEKVFSEIYDRYYTEITNYFSDREKDLLVLNICAGDGWEKLCPFLELPIPNIAFPHENRGGTT